MDFTKEEASIVYMDCVTDLESSVQLEVSDEEENQLEIEEMLYSSVFYNDPSPEETPVAPSSSPTPINSATTVDVVERHHQKVTAPLTINKLDLISKRPQIQAGCFRSEFNHPARTSASRYYDVNQDRANSNPTFVAPTNPSTKSTVKNQPKRKELGAVSSRIHARSANEKTYLCTENVKARSNICAGSSSSAPTTREDTNVLLEASKLMKDINLSALPSSQSPSPSVATVSISSENGPALDIEDKQPKNVCQSTPGESFKKGQKAMPTFELKVSKVLSSMMDDESRSSVEESQSTSMCVNQNSMSESGWSLGMLYADIANKYSIDSIEEESVSSLQLQDSSVIADSRTNTPDIPARLESDDGIDEPSRYQLHLKTKVHEEGLIQNDTDSESEVGSVVEVAPPAKATPPLVDLSDGEYTPVSNMKDVSQSTPTKASNEIAVLLSKSTNGSAINQIIDISSDDDLMVLEILDSSKPKTSSAQKGQKRHSVQTRKLSNSEDSLPPKRLSYQKDTSWEESSMEGDLLKHAQTFLNKSIVKVPQPQKMSKLDRWLHNPIKASRHYDHGKYLKNMSDDPQLWQLCSADKNKVQSQRGQKCKNCNQFGHKLQNCREPKKTIVCHMCGISGHTETRCPNKMCLKCGTKKNVFVEQCKECWHKHPCKICCSTAHDWKTCPDLWRRYHLTTSNGDLTIHSGDDMRQRSEQWCSNCAKNGHFSHECRKPYWKCESISPFIQSYAPIAAEEAKYGTVNSYTMMLTSDAVQLLDCATGQDFLKSLSVECQVPIYASFDVEFQKLTLRGPSSVVEKVRYRVIEWVHQASRKKVSAVQTVDIEAPKEPSSDAVLLKVPSPGTAVSDKTSISETLHKEVSHIPVAEAETFVMKSAWELPSLLPMDHLELAEILAEELKILDNPLPCNQTVKQLYEKMCQLPIEQPQTRERKRCLRLLSMILLGQCGFENGKQHVKILKKHLTKLMSGRGNIRTMNKLVKKHYNYIFGGNHRNDFGHLVNKFYSDEYLVKMFDCGQVNEGHQSASSPTDSIPIESSMTQSLSSSHENSLGDKSVEHSVSPLKSEKTDIPTGIQMAGCHRETHIILATLEKKVKETVPTVIKNLSSRFIFCKNRAALEKMYKLFSRNCSVGTDRLRLMRRMKGVIDKLCKSYNIKLP